MEATEERTEETADEAEPAPEDRLIFMPITQTSTFMDQLLTCAVLSAKSNGSGSIGSAANRIGAVTDTETEVLVTAEAGNVSWLTSQSLSLTKHVGDAKLLYDMVLARYSPIELYI